MLTQILQRLCYSNNMFSMFKLATSIIKKNLNFAPQKILLHYRVCSWVKEHMDNKRMFFIRRIVLYCQS